MSDITRTAWTAKTKSGRTQFNTRLECSCGWATVGNNTFSPEHLTTWADKMTAWHLTVDPDHSR